MTNMNRRQLIRRAALGAGALTLAPSMRWVGAATTGPLRRPGSTPTELIPTTLQLSWTPSVQFGGSFLGLDRGYYAEEGLDISFGLGGPNVAGDAQTVSGAALMNISGGDGVARSNVEGAGLTIVGTQYQKSPGTLLSLADKDLTTPDALVGTRIAVAGADNPALLAFLQINDIAESDVELIPSQYDPAVLIADQADSIFCFYNDLPVALRVQEIPYNAMLLADFGYNPASQTYTVLTTSLEDPETRAQLVSLLRAEIRGWQDYKTDFLEAAQLAIDMYPDAGLDLETQEATAEVNLDLMYSDVTDEFGFAWFTDEVVETNIALFADLGIEGADASLFDRTLLEEIFAEGPVV